MIRFNMKAFRENDYFTVGLMLSTIIMQGGEPPRIFSPICQDISGGLKKCNPVIEELPNLSLRSSLFKVIEHACHAFGIGLNDNSTKNYRCCTCSIIITIHILAINLLSGLRPGDYRVFFFFFI